MIALTNENLIELIFRSLTLYDLQAQFDKIKNKMINQIRLNTLSYDKIFKSMGSSKVLFTEANNEMFPYPAVLLPNGNILIASIDKNIRFWDPESGLCIKTLTTESKIDSFAVLQNGNIMAYLYGGKVQVWNN
jgi:WD40 repeat protein